MVRPVDDAFVTGDGVDARFGGNALGGDLVPHAGDRTLARPDEGDPGLPERPRELGVLRKETVTGVHRIGARVPYGLEYPVYPQVAFRGGGLADAHGFVRHAHMQGPGIGIRVHGDGGNAHLSGRLDDAAGNLAAIGDEYFVEHDLIEALLLNAPQ